MKIVCAFKGDLLLKQEFNLEPEKYEALRSSVADANSEEVSTIDIIVFEDDELESFINPSTRPESSMLIDRQKIVINKQVINRQEMEVDIYWQNCDDEQLAQHFSPQDIAKINENKSYYDSLGNEKYQDGFVFNWPYEIAPARATVNAYVREMQMYKVVNPVLIEYVGE